MTEQNSKTEDLVYWGIQYCSEGKVAYVFKRNYFSQDQILIVFNRKGECVHPNKGSIMKVTYHLDKSGSYCGTNLMTTDPDAFD